MRSVVYDAGPLIAAERNDRLFWAEHRIRLELGIVPCVPSPIADIEHLVSNTRKKIRVLET